MNTNNPQPAFLDMQQKQLDSQSQQTVSRLVKDATGNDFDTTPPTQTSPLNTGDENENYEQPAHIDHPQSKLRGLNIFKELFYEITTKIGLKKRSDFMTTVDSKELLELKKHRLHEMYGSGSEVILKNKKG